MRILAGGSLEDVPRDPELCREFVAALGIEIVGRGHVLLNGCRGSVDKEIATAALEWLSKNGSDPDKSIISYCTKVVHPSIELAGSVNRPFLTGR